MKTQEKTRMKECLVDVSTPLNDLVDQINDFSLGLGGQSTNIALLSVHSTRSNTTSPFLTCTTQEISRWEKVLRKLERSPLTIVGFFSGNLNHMALDLLLCTDYRFASKDFSLSLPSHNGLLWPGTGIHRLVNQFGQNLTRQLVFRDIPIRREEALQLKLIDSESDHTQIHTHIQKFANLSGQDVSIRRQLIKEAHSISFEDALGGHLAACNREISI